MSLVKNKTVFLFLVILSSLLVSTTIFAVEKRDFSSGTKADFQSKAISSQNEDEANAPTAENLWKAKQAGDFEKAARIRAIMDEEAKKFWRSPGGDEMVIDLPCLAPPENDEAFFKSYMWGNDIKIASGTVSGGISTDYDDSNNLYAVRCTTYSGTANAKIKVYKSTNDGASWSYLCGFYISGGFSYSYPVVLTGTSGTPDKLYIFYLKSSGNGDIGLARYTQSGTHEGFYSVKVDADTITYFTVCANYGLGSRLMVAYQKEDDAHKVYTITSSDYGETWGNQVSIGSGAHPDIAYGRNGWVYLVREVIEGSDTDVRFGRSSNYGESVSWWRDFESLTSDSYDDDYPKIAALHTLPDSTPHVWVAYNHDYANSGNWDLRYAYSTNGGKDWSKNHNLANSTTYNEMACDLWVGRNSDFTYTNICYLKTRYVSFLERYYDIYWGFANTGDPTDWHSPRKISDFWGAFDYDGRKVCQGTYGNISAYWSGVVYAGHPFIGNYTNLYFDNRQWTDVEDEIAEGELPEKFSLSDNYPNPFNPETRIQYTVGSKQTNPVVLRIYNVLGQVVRTLVNEPKEPGTYEVIWDGKDESGDEVASGVYFYKLEAEDFTQTKKMVLIR